MNLKKLLVTLLLCVSTLSFAQNKGLELQSPNGAIKVSLHLSDKIYYTISYNQDELLKDNLLMLQLRNAELGQNSKLISSKKNDGNEVIKPYISLKYSSVKNNYNSLLLNFQGSYAVEFRAFDEGVAYHFTMSQKGDVEVINEDFSIHFPNEYLLHTIQPKSFKTSYEEPYSSVSSKEWSTEKMSTLPFLIDTKKQCKILISESQLSDYPCMFLKSTGDNGVTSTFPKVPLDFGEDGDRSLKITKEALPNVKTISGL